jgi:prepilin-type N-terminal cleavage/methylation domain-containing protein
MRVTDRGFSLVEVIIASGLLAGAVAALAHLIIVCARIDTAAHHLTAAVLLAQEKLEQLRSAPALGSTPSTTEYLDGDGNVVCPAAQACPGAVYRREWEIQPSTPAPAAVFVHVRVRAAAGAAREIHLITVRPGTR